MAKIDRGTKRQCLNCGIKFYDLTRDPVICPGCGTTFAVEVAQTPPVPEPVAKPAKPEKTEASKKTDAEVKALDETENDDDKEDTGEDIPDVEGVDDDDDDDDAENNDAFLVADDDDSNDNFGVGTKKDEEDN